DCGNAGTAMRLLTGLLAGQSFQSTLTGDASLSKRPMKRVIAPLTLMGTEIQSEAGGFPPLIINSNKVLQAIEYKTEVASAQIKSAILLAGLYASGVTTVEEPHPTRDYTEKMLSELGWPIEFRPGFARLRGGHRLQAGDIQVPADFSSAAFFIVAACLIPSSDLLIKSVGMNPRRTGLLAALRLMGADISEDNYREQAGEPVADLHVKHAALTGVEVPESLVPDMIDEFPALFVAAALARGETRISGAAELRVKESDRIAVMSDALRKLGAQIIETPDGAIIRGGKLQGGEADSHGDHRIAMSLAIAGQLASGTVQISDCDNVATSFPGFVALSKSVGLGLNVE
ncbi:MAG: 3-phosphoshikimate 1-carboxyvinyltransferase, partial [Arenimonas sp.]